MTVQDVSRETLLKTRKRYQLYFENFEIYLDELLWWNRKVNLVSREVSRETVREHIIHSLIPSAMSLLDGSGEWIDAGTGGGLPGIPLAIVEPEKKWLLVDMVSKKIAAVKQMIHKLNLKNASGEARSIEKMVIDPGTGVITKHAFPVNSLLAMLEMQPWSKLIIYKGAIEAEEELQEVDLPVPATIYRFEFGEDEPFYEGKGLVVMEAGNR